MEQGKSDEKIREQAKLTGAKRPDRIANKPEVINGLEMYWKAFTDLMADRELGMGEGPIRWTAISDWAARRGINGDDFERLVFLLREMDSVYMEHRNRQSKRDSSKAKRAGKKARGAIRHRK